MQVSLLCVYLMLEMLFFFLGIEHTTAYKLLFLYTIQLEEGK